MEASFQKLKNNSKLKKIFEKYKVKKAYLFGSFARGQHKDTSDIDIMVEFIEKPGLVDYVRLTNEIEELLGRPTDLISKDGLLKELKPYIQKDLTLIYEN